MFRKGYETEPRVNGPHFEFPIIASSGDSLPVVDPACSCQNSALVVSEGYDSDCHSQTRSCPSFRAPNASHSPDGEIATEETFPCEILSVCYNIRKPGHFPEPKDAGGEANGEEIRWWVERRADNLGVRQVKIVLLLNAPSNHGNGIRRTGWGRCRQCCIIVVVRIHVLVHLGCPSKYCTVATRGVYLLTR